MDRAVPAVFPLNLHGRLGEWSAPIVLDVRSPDELFAIDRLIPGSTRRSSKNIDTCWRALPAGTLVVVCDGSGTPQSEQVAETLVNLCLKMVVLESHGRAIPVTSTMKSFENGNRPKRFLLSCSDRNGQGAGQH